MLAFRQERDLFNTERLSQRDRDRDLQTERHRALSIEFVSLAYLYSLSTLLIMNLIIHMIIKEAWLIGNWVFGYAGKQTQNTGNRDRGKEVGRKR